MNIYIMTVYLYCFVNYKNNNPFPWRKMRVLETKRCLSLQSAHEAGETLCDVHNYRKEADKRAVMYEITTNGAFDV